MAQWAQGIQLQVKKTTSSSFLSLFRLVSGLMVGLTVALIGEAIVGYGSVAFTFVVCTMIAAYWRVTKHYQWRGVIVLDLILVLIALLMRMYILIAPNM